MSRKWKHFILAGVAPLVVVGSVTYWAADRVVVKPLREALAEAPPGWMDSIRTIAPLPAAVSALVLPRTEDGDAAALVQLATAGTTWSPNDDVETAYQRMRDGEEATSADSAVWLAIAADTVLDRLVAAARHTRWNGMDLMLRYGDVGPGEDLFELRALPYRELLAAGHQLAIRARIRLAGGDRQVALEDLQTIMGLGEHMARRHPGGVWVGSKLVSIAAKELGHYAQVVGDAALADAAGLAQAWADADADAVVSWFALGAEPDSALALVHDPTLPLGRRCSMLLSYTLVRSMRPRVMLFGFPRQVSDELDRLATDPDPDLAKFAQILAGTVNHFNDLSILERKRYMEDRLLPLLANIG